MNECLRSMRMTTGSAKKDHKLEVGKNYERSLEFEYVHIHPRSQWENGNYNRFWNSPEQPPSNSPCSPNVVAPKVLVSISDIAE